MSIEYNNKGIVRNGLVMCLDAANTKSYPGSGTVMTDLSGLRNNGTLTNGPGYSSNNKGLITFDYLDDFINCGAVPQINSSLTGLTAEVLIRSGLKRTECLMENGTNHTTNTFYLFKENVNNFTFSVYGTYHDVIYANIVYTADTWYHITGVWTTGERNKIYINGVDASTNPGGTIQTNVRDGNANMQIGARPGSSSFNFSGLLSVSRLYNRALTPAEVKQNFEAVRGRVGI